MVEVEDVRRGRVQTIKFTSSVFGTLVGTEEKVRSWSVRTVVDQDKRDESLCVL